MESLDLHSCLEAACEAARRAGAVLEDWRHRFQVQEKGRFDLVTDADFAAQQSIRSFLLDRFPDHGFIGEEGSGASVIHSAEEGKPTWIVDPLDGTTNYVHDCPVYAVSIGMECHGILQLGVIFDPRQQELFRAAHGMGAWLNDRPLKTSSTPRLEEALLSTGFPPDLRGHEHSLEVWHRLSFRAQSLRRTGSTAINLAYVAAGRHDGFWIDQAHPWDIAAGVVLVREAGGSVTDLSGGPFRLDSPAMAATNGQIHASLISAIAES